MCVRCVRCVCVHACVLALVRLGCAAVSISTWSLSLGRRCLAGQPGAEAGWELGRRWPVGGCTSPSPCLLGSGRTRRRCWVWPPVPGDTRGWRPSSFCGAELRPRQVRASPLASGHSLGPSPGRGLSGPSEPGCPSSRPSVRPEGTAALKKSALTCVLHCCCRYLGDGPAGCATRRTSAESARGFPAWEPRLQSRTGAPREAGALAWGRAACWWQFEEPTARFVPPRVRGPVRVP